MLFSPEFKLAIYYAAAPFPSQGKNQPFVSTWNQQHAHLPHKTPSFGNISLTQSSGVGVGNRLVGEGIECTMYAQEQTASESSQICPTLTSQSVPAGEHRGAALKKTQGTCWTLSLFTKTCNLAISTTLRKHQGNAFTFSRISLLQAGNTQFSPALPIKE